MLPSSLFQSPHYPVSNTVQHSQDGQSYTVEPQHCQNQLGNQVHYNNNVQHYSNNSQNFQNDTHEYWEDPITQSTNPLNYGSETPVSTASQAPSHHQSLSFLPNPYAPSYTPSRTQDRTLPSKGKSNQQVYRQLQFPTASNNGSMKKKKRGSAEGEETKSPSPGFKESQSVSPSLPTLEKEYRDQDVRIWSV